MIPPEFAFAKIAAAELTTVDEYSKILEEVQCPQCRRVIESIIDEELVHVGEAIVNMKRVNHRWAEKLAEGEKEGLEIAKSMVSKDLELPKGL